MVMRWYRPVCRKARECYSRFFRTKKQVGALLRSDLGTKILLLRLLNRYIKKSITGLFVPWRKMARPFWLLRQELQVNIRVISLERRRDRRILLRKHFAEMGLSFAFFPGVENPNGRLGCAVAHANLLREWISNGEGILMVCEDDVMFNCSNAELSRLLAKFLRNPGLDVLCLGHSSVGPFISISGKMKLTMNTQTTSCYVVKPGVMQALLGSFDRSAEKLAEGKAHNKWALDVLWKGLQRESMVFAIPQEAIAIQAPSFSDIENTWVDYGT